MAPPKDRSSANLDALLDNMEDEWGETDGELPDIPTISLRAEPKMFSMLFRLSVSPNESRAIRLPTVTPLP